MKKPNVVMIVADDHRYDALHCAGDPVVRTSHLDALAAKGVRFANTHMMGGRSAALCTPCRACIHSGVSVFRCADGQTIAPHLALLPETLRHAGYATFAVGKWHNDKHAFDRSFAGGSRLFFGGMNDHYDVPLHDYTPGGTYEKEDAYRLEAHSTDVFTEAAAEFLSQYERDEPFMLYLAYTAPHDPRMAPPEYHAMYREEEIPLPPNYMPEHPFDNGELQIRDEQLEAWPRTPEAVRKHNADYYAMITHMDAGIGRVMRTLQERGLADNTIVVYTADHGLALGRHGLMGKQNLYDSSVRIPLIVAGSGVPEGAVVADLTCQIDIFPTICELTGTPVPETVEGRSLAAAMRGSDDGRRAKVGAAYKELQRMIKDERWKLIRYTKTADGQGTDKLQLFDLQEDPWEINDLSGLPEYADKVEELLYKLRKWQEEVGDPFL
ncbi:Arylsulfatase [Paenibacillus konkukensis]|uniref:Arylsulfatase n=1 Tax=Paenibacillus konkukensis TaxID=2020716 RepID=A0ABY4RXI9_9BACL|nr:sulfatase-like hydrolase/transferase [Paenibacillus konkukensis]UQZ86137.1 Arylsulfatase [Paenibacillus konkukensis]